VTLRERRALRAKMALSRSLPREIWRLRISRSPIKREANCDVPPFSLPEHRRISVLLQFSTMEAFLLTRNLLTLLLCAPIHGVCALLCARDARFFDLVLLWARTRLPALFANLRIWKASSYCPLVIDLPNRHGRRAGDL